MPHRNRITGNCVVKVTSGGGEDKCVGFAAVWGFGDGKGV